MPYEFIAIIIMIWGLTVDFKKDLGLNLKAKFFHFFMLATLLVLQTGLIDNLVSFVLNFESSIEAFSNSMGMVPAGLNIFISCLTLIFSLLVQVFNFSLIFRKNFARKGNLILLPFWLLIYIGHYFFGIDPQSDVGFTENIQQMLPGILLIGGIPCVYIVLYTRPFMKAFFEYRNPVSADLQHSPVSADL